jgi:hypothetical protein
MLPPQTLSKAPLKQAPKRRTKKVEEVIEELEIEVPLTISQIGRVVKKKEI